jgi:hypothetical protein
MTSLIAWLDTSSEEQRRVRELIALFTQTESRDELGIGQIRDAFSETLFPGTSVIQTRARYFLFVPWIYKEGRRLARGGPALKAWADRQERKLVEALREAGDVEGLIGRRAGPAVKILPSTIYWSGLARFGILARDVASDQLETLSPQQGYLEADELALRAVDGWHPTIPAAPSGFPGRVDGGFDLTHEEAVWLAERVLETVPDTLLAHVVGRTGPPDPDSWAPWADSGCLDAPLPIIDQLEHARLFSLGMHGAALLYNLLIAENYEAAGHTTIPDPVSTYRVALDEWSDDCRDASAQLRSWDRDGMWEVVLRASPRIGPRTRAFVDAWLNTVCRGKTRGVGDDSQLRRLVGDRERVQKKAQSRLDNERLLRTWSGHSGSAQLTYRWPQVRRIVTDVYDGLDAPA